MSSSGGSYSGPISSPVGPPIPGLPVAGANSTIGSPYEYGKFQNFLPDIQASGPNPSATGLRPDMFIYRSPTGVVAQGDTSALRDQLAQLQSSSSQGAQGAQAPLQTSGWYGTPEGQYLQYEQSQGVNPNNFTDPRNMSPPQYAAFMQTQLPPSSFQGSG